MASTRQLTDWQFHCLMILRRLYTRQLRMGQTISPGASNLRSHQKLFSNGISLAAGPGLIEIR